jgi:aspartyl-tRNA(Asn)/glutamyl-tRNA(Gln) amidotransferase subunit C
MARLTLDQVRHVAQLAALELDEAEARTLCDDLGSILDHMAALDALDVSGIEPTFHPLQTAAPLAPLREDRVQPSLSRDEALAAAPASEHGGFAVPKVLDGDA